MTFEEYLDYWGRDLKAEERRETMIGNIMDILEDYDEETPDDLKQSIINEKSNEILKAWHKKAARSRCIAEFRKAADL